MYEIKSLLTLGFCKKARRKLDYHSTELVIQLLGTIPYLRLIYFYKTRGIYLLVFYKYLDIVYKYLNLYLSQNASNSI